MLANLSQNFFRCFADLPSPGRSVQRDNFRSRFQNIRRALISWRYVDFIFIAELFVDTDKRQMYFLPETGDIIYTRGTDSCCSSLLGGRREGGHNIGAIHGPADPGLTGYNQLSFDFL